MTTELFNGTGVYKARYEYIIDKTFLIGTEVDYITVKGICPKTSDGKIFDFNTFHIDTSPLRKKGRVGGFSGRGMGFTGLGFM